MKMLDTKGASLRWLEELDCETLSNLDVLADWMEQAIPGTIAATRTRRIVVLARTALAEAQEPNLNALWCNVARAVENGSSPEEAVMRQAGHEDFHMLIGSPSAAVVEVEAHLYKARELARQLEALRDAVIIQAGGP